MKGLRSYLLGWLNYFAPANSIDWRNGQDKWLRHRLRALRLQQTKRGRTTYAVMRKLGLNHLDAVMAAGHRRSWWKASAYSALGKAMPIQFFDDLGLPHVARARGP